MLKFLDTLIKLLLLLLLLLSQTSAISRIALSLTEICHSLGLWLVTKTISQAVFEGYLEGYSLRLK